MESKNVSLEELHKKILLTLYLYYKETVSFAIAFDELYTQCNIGNVSKTDFVAAIRYLSLVEYIDIIYSGGNNGIVSGLTASGKEYVRNNLIFKKNVRANTDAETNRKEQSTKTQISANTGDIFHAQEQYKEVKDKNVSSCFGVATLAECFVKQMDKIAESQLENVCMLGIFGPWGRGKSFFFQKVKDYIEQQDKKPIDYKIVEFNAWKYQDTPALWAYLYETIYDKGTSWCKKRKFFCKNLVDWGDVFLFIIIIITLYLTSLGIKWILDDPSINEFAEKWEIPIIILSMAYSFIRAMIKNPARAFAITKKYIHKCSYKEHLGIQNEIEEILESLLKTIIDNPNKEKLLLYVDDIDRCSTEKMLAVIDSLRTILENPEIRKRLIIVCSIDASKLKQGYISHYKIHCDDNNLCTRYAREQLDKLFISGIGLAPIDTMQQITYIHKLADIPKGSNATEDQIPYSIYRENNSYIVTNETEVIESISDKDMVSLMAQFLNDHKDKEITPRKLRIMYYQLWLANNIISKVDGSLFTKRTAMEVLNHSLNYPKEEEEKEVFSDVVKMVVPY